MQRAVIYARYSSGKQTEASIERQVELCEEYAAAHNITIVEHYIDRKKTGKSDNRPEFLRMIYNSAQHLFDIVLVWRFDRFSRNMDDAGAYERTLRSNQVKLISATEPIPEGAHGSIIKGVIWGSNESYSAELAAKVMDGMARAAQKGQSIGGPRIFGYRIEDKHFVLNETEAAIIRLIFERYASGKSMTEIARELNERGLRNSKGNPFDVSVMRRILSDKRYIGILLYKGEDIGTRIPPIVDTELFNRVQLELKKNRKAPARTKGVAEQYLLTTKLFCGTCGKPMSGVSGTSKTGQKHQYYVCINRYKRKECQKGYIVKTKAEEAVLKVVKKVLLKNNIEQLTKLVVKCCQDAQDNGELLRLQAALKETKKAINGLVEALEQGRATSTIMERLEVREKEQQMLESAIAKEKSLHHIPTEDDVKRFFDSVVKGNIDIAEHDRMMIDILVNSVHLYDAENGTQKMTVLLNVQNGQETVTLDDVAESSSNVHLVGHPGLEPGTKRL